MVSRWRLWRYNNAIMTTQLPYLICSILSFVPAIVLHEMAHGFAAWKLGDPTAKRAGRLSFNPLAHIDPFGTVIMPFLLMAMNMPVFGYAKPVPYNPAYFKDPRKGDLIVGLVPLPICCSPCWRAWSRGCSTGSPPLRSGWCKARRSSTST